MRLEGFGSVSDLFVFPLSPPRLAVNDATEKPERERSGLFYCLVSRGSFGNTRGVSVFVASSLPRCLFPSAVCFAFIPACKPPPLLRLPLLPLPLLLFFFQCFRRVVR